MGVRMNIVVGNKVAGRVIGDTFHTDVNSRKQFLRRPAAVLLNVTSVKEAEDAGATLLEVNDRDTGRVYMTPISTLWDYGFPADPHGQYMALELPYWDVINQRTQVYN